MLLGKDDFELILGGFVLTGISALIISIYILVY